MDCMEGMKEFPDKFFDLAIVDPPYGGGAKAEHASPENLTGGGADWERHKAGRFGGRFRQYHFGDGQAEEQAEDAPESPTEGQTGGLSAALIRAERTGRGRWARKYNPGEIFDGADVKHWDVAPGEDYFRELARVSKNQIIWGGNYFGLPPTRCFLVWRKLTISESFSMAMCEYAWTSFNDNAKLFECMPQGAPGEKRFHPTQKPVKLYSWILNLYAKDGYKILDTHAGSGSSLVACRRRGLEAWGFEIDPEYWKAAKARLDTELAQVNMYDIYNGQVEMFEQEGLLPSV